MKKILFGLVILFPFHVLAADFIHPMDFDGSDAQKNKVVQIIKARVKKDYCGTVDMCQPSMLRMMEQQNLNAFKDATKATNREIMDRVIKDYCYTVDLCNYTTILMMYKENLRASRQQLEW